MAEHTSHCQDDISGRSATDKRYTIIIIYWLTKRYGGPCVTFIDTKINSKKNVTKIFYAR